MKFEDLKELYQKKSQEYGLSAYKHISEILKNAKMKHYEDWKKKPTKARDHEQSWRSFKGKNLERLVQFIISNEAEKLGLRVINGNKIERKKMLPKELSEIKRKLAVDFGKFGLHLPDVDIIIYNPTNNEIIAVVSCKVTLRERIAQTGYWKLKLLQDEVTQNIKVYFITPDEDGTLTTKKPIKKGRAIVETDTDGAYLMTTAEIEKSSKIKLFEEFIIDLRNMINEG